MIFKKKILIVEINPYHGEILPGFCRLFQIMGFKVDILMRKEVYKMNPFVYYSKTELPNISYGDAEFIKDRLKNINQNDYLLLFFSTNVFWESNYNYSSVIRYLKFIPSGILGSLFIEHNNLSLQYDDALELLQQGRVFNLLNYKYKNIKIKSFNPHYFGSVPIFDGNKGNKKNILVIGRSNFNKTNLKKIYRVVDEFDDKFSFTLIGGNVVVDNRYKEQIIIKGRLNFKDLYNEIAKCDYLLAMLENDIEDEFERTKYFSGTTSGTVQLSLGFNKPMIIGQLFAKNYGFDNSSSVIYKKDLLEAFNLINKTEMSKYNKMRATISNKARIMDSESVSNIKHFIYMQKIKKIIGLIKKEDRLITREINLNE